MLPPRQAHVCDSRRSALGYAGTSIRVQIVLRAAATRCGGRRRQTIMTMAESSGRRRRWKSGAPQLVHFALEHLLLLPLGAVIALIWANTGPESYFRFARAIAFAVNDVAMAIFFALITKEVVEATASGGVLHTWRRTVVPVIAAVGAALAAASLHVYIVNALDEPVLAETAWPVTLASDIAVSYFVARIIFGRHAVIPFLLLLAIASNVLGFVVLALLNPLREHDYGVGGLLLAVAFGVAYALRRMQVKSVWPYLLGAGSVSWLAFYWGGIHPALALVPIVPFMPHAARDPGFFVDASPNAGDALSRLEIWGRYPAQVSLFLFGLVNAGVPAGAFEPGVWGLPIAMLVGKPMGVLIATGGAVALGLKLPHRVGWRELTVLGLIMSLGFSVGLFFSTALLPPGQLRSEASMGVLIALVGIPAAFACARLLRIGRFAVQ
jgi:Na+:H+ antiporter, NhaA family